MATTTNEAPAAWVGATSSERATLLDLLALQRDARGDHQALADVRRQIAGTIDDFLVRLRRAGVNTEALLNELDPS